jgi:hypothetical protein
MLIARQSRAPSGSYKTPILGQSLARCIAEQANANRSVTSRGYRLQAKAYPTELLIANWQFI